jgi:hypothetical protein
MVLREKADDVTQSLVHLSQSQVPALSQNSADAPANRADRAKAQHLFIQGNKFYEKRAFAMKAAAQNYDRKEYSHRVDELIRGYTRDAISKIGAAGWSSAKPHSGGALRKCGARRR